MTLAAVLLTEAINASTIARVVMSITIAITTAVKKSGCGVAGSPRT